MTNTILQGDCLELMKDMSEKSIDYVFCSPPYNRKRNDKYKYYDDTIIDYFALLRESINESLRVTKKHVFFNIQKNYYNKVDVNRIIGHFAEKIVEIIIWEKTNPMPAAGNAVTNSYEFFIVLGHTSLKSNTTYTKNIISTSVNGKMPESHKAVMKQEVANWFIEKFTNKGDIILDPFAGTGTTGVACKNLNRNFILIEQNPEYCKIAEARINSAT